MRGRFTTVLGASRPVRGTVVQCRAQFSALSSVQDVLCQVHALSGIPWAVLIPLSTGSLTLLTLPIAIVSRRQQARIAALRPLLAAQSSEIARRIRQTSDAKSFERLYTRETTAQRRKLHRKHHVNLLSLLALPLMKIPLWITFSLTLRSMSGASIPYFTPLGTTETLAMSSESEGVLPWIHDLTASDPLVLLPVLFGTLNLMNVEIMAHARGREGTRLTKTMESFGRFVSIAFIPIAAQMPAAVCLYWTSSSGLTVLQNLALNRFYPLDQSHDIKRQASYEVAQSEEQNRLELPGIDDTVGDKISNNDTPDTLARDKKVK